jgi:hypothetical protein
MNVNELYENITPDQHGNIVVSDTAVTINQDKKSPVVLLKKTAADNADLTAADGKAADRAHLEKNITKLKTLAQVTAEKAGGI